MLPSSGYFRSINCPFFDSGLCERPHCHFRHAKKDPTVNNFLRSNSVEDASSFSASKEDKPDLLKLVTEAVRKIEQEVNQNNDFPKPQVPETKPIQASLPASNKYIEVLQENSDSEICSTSSGKKPVSNVLEYKPTPIAQLKKMHENKYMQISSKRLLDDLVYDPVSNFSASNKKIKLSSYEALSNYTYTPSSVKVTNSAEPNKASDKSESDGGKYLAALEDSDCVDDDAKFSDDENYVAEYKPEPAKTVSAGNLIESESEDKLDDKFDIVNQIITASKKTDEYLSNKSKIAKVKSETTHSNSIVSKNVSNKHAKPTKNCKNDPKLLEENANNYINSHLDDESSNHSEIKSIQKAEKIREKNIEKSEKSNEKDIDKNEKKKDKQLSSSHEESSNQRRNSTSDKDKSNHTTKKSSSHKSSKLSSSSHKKSLSSNSVEKKSSSSHSIEKKSSSHSTEKKSSSSSHSTEKKSSSHSTEKKSSSSHSIEKKSSSHSTEKRSSSSSHSNERKLSSSSHSKEKKSSSSSSEKKSSSNHKHKDSSKHSSQKHSSSHLRKHSGSSSSEKKYSSESRHNSNSKHSSSSKSRISKNSHHKEKPDKSEKAKSLDLFGDDSDESTSKKGFKESHVSNSKKHKLENNNASDSSDYSSDEDMGDLRLEEVESDDTPEVPVDPSLFINKDDVDELDEHDTYEECLRIFNEYEPVEDAEETKAQVKKPKLDENDDSFGITGKKRIAHNPGSNVVLSRKKPAPPPPGRLSASQVMHNRFATIQKMRQEQSKNESNAFMNSSASLAGGKKRIAHVPNVSAILTATKNIKSKMLSPPQTSETTQIHTNPKGTARVAHIPKTNVLNRPVIPAEYGSKVPVNVRQRYLNLIIDECVKMYEDEEEAYSRALEEEKNSYDRSTNRNVYLNVVVNTIKRLRTEVATGVVHEALTSQEPDEFAELCIDERPPSPVAKKKPPPKPNAKTVSHEFVLGGKKAANVSYSIQRSRNKVSEDITEAALYKLLQPYLLTKEQLDENGYPRLHPTEHGKAVILKQEKKNICTDPLEKICCRCGARFKISPKGVYLTKNECVYHWGKAWKKRIAGAIDNRYTCCQGDLQSEGCSLAKVHVSDTVDYDNLTGFVKTLPKSPPLDGNCGVYALDCEMCYTAKGCELSRITVIGSNLKPVYETFVKPENPIVDYNTRFSGITEEDMIGVKTTLRDVQAVLLSKFNDKTILIGHSLESDFKAMKLIHDTVVDTSIVFPHRLGLPYKRALRNLMAEILKKIIQNDVDGHDSQEDALACMELMLWKIKDDLRKLR